MNSCVNEFIVQYGYHWPSKFDIIDASFVGTKHIFSSPFYARITLNLEQQDVMSPLPTFQFFLLSDKSDHHDSWIGTIGKKSGGGIYQKLSLGEW